MDINDTLGHEAGDAFLAAFGEFLRARIRKEDTACPTEERSSS